MDRENYSLMVTVMRIIAGVFAAAAFGLMFVRQLTNGAMFDEIAFGQTNAASPMPLAFIGYILLAIGAIASIVLIFAKGALGNAKTVKLADFVVAAVLILGSILVVLTKVWWFIGANTTVFDSTGLGAGPIVACCFGCVAAVLNIVNGLVEEKI